LKISDNYRTVAGPSEGQYKEKGSKFLAFAWPVSSAEEISEKIEALKKQYHDARHHCYAWALGPEGTHFRAVDDGEPNHSAGDPILGQIRSRELSDTLVVVVRYFGGTKLGVGGLINAYRTAAANALDHNRIINKFVLASLFIEFDFPSTGPVMRLIEEAQAEIVSQKFGESCHLMVRIRKRDVTLLETKLNLLNGVKIIVE
jgi:uncharacterized YigZ family protein